SGADFAERRAAQPAFEQSAIVSESEVGDRSWVAGCGSSAVAAAAEPECGSGLLLAESCTDFAGGGSAAGVFHGPGTRFCAERADEGGSNASAACEAGCGAGRICGGYKKSAGCRPRDTARCYTARKLGVRLVRRADLPLAECATRRMVRCRCGSRRIDCRT